MQSLLPTALGACNGTAAPPAASDGTKDVCHLPGLVAAVPTHRAAKVHCQVFLDVAPLKDRRTVVHLAGHLHCGQTSSTNCRSDSALVLLRSTLACCHRSCYCYHPKFWAAWAMPLTWQACAGRWSSWSTLPMSTRCVKGLFAMVPPPPPLPLVSGEDDAHSTSANSSPIASVYPVCRVLKAHALLDRPFPACHAGDKDGKGISVDDCVNTNSGV